MFLELLMTVNVMSALCVRVLRKPELASEIDHEALGKLLPEKLLKPLEEQYLSKQQVDSLYFSQYNSL